MPDRILIAQFGTKHGHAKSVLQVMLENPDVDVVGCYEPDPDRRKQCRESGDPTWSAVHWFDEASEVLDDPDIVAVASEGSNREALDHTEALVAAGKHVIYDKPAGNDYARFVRVVEAARQKGLRIQLGYMFRKHAGFMQIADWARSGFLGHVFQIRAHMSTWLPEASPGGAATGRENLAYFNGGVLYDLGGHMLDQIVWILGRPARVTSFLQHADPGSTTLDFMDNTLAVLEYDRALATVDIAAMEPRPPARRFEVYGTEGSAIMDQFDQAENLRLCLEEAKGDYPAGLTEFRPEETRRHVADFAAFVSDIKGESEPLRSLDHELLVQETLMRATGGVAG